MTTDELIRVLKDLQKEYGEMDVVYEEKPIEEYHLIEYLDERYVELSRK